MKLGIVIPLKSKQVAKNWTTTCKNLESTVRSVLSQLSDQYVCVVVGHEKPTFMAGLQEHSHCRFLAYKEFAPPITNNMEMENQLKYEFDRCNKILKGIMVLSKEEPDITHWYALDADDFISRDFVNIIYKHKDNDAIILDNGYFYFKNTGVINVENEFSAYCGSSAVLASHLIPELPDIINEKSFRLIPFGNLSHVHMKQNLIKKGLSVAIPDERIVMYVRENGENISNAAYCNTWLKKSKKAIKMFLRARKIDKSVKESFGIKA